MARRRFGAIRKLPSGRWQARHLDPEGRERTAPVTFRTKTDADRWLATQEEKQLRGAWRDPSRGSESVNAFFAKWLPARRVKGRPLALKTRDTYIGVHRRQIESSIGLLALNAVSVEAVREWHTEVASATGSTATRHAYALLHAIMESAVHDDLITANPCRIRGAGQPTSPPRQLLSLEDVRKLQAEMPKHLRPLVATAFWADLRLGEVLAIQRRDVDLEAGVLHVRQQVIEPTGGQQEAEPKASSRRTLHLPTQAVVALQEQLDARGSLRVAERLFVRQNGEVLRHHHVQSAWRSARKRAGFDDAHFHDLRHAGLTLLAQMGASLAELMHRGGHSTSRAAMTYQHASAERDRLLAERLSELDG